MDSKTGKLHKLYVWTFFPANYSIVKVCSKNKILTAVGCENEYELLLSFYKNLYFNNMNT